MADSPAVQAPLDPREQPILEKILLIRDHLFLLKQDKSTYVKSTDIIPIYDKVIDQVHLLNDVRVEKRLEQNRVDTVLDDCFQLISLFFLTIGRNNEAPAIYSTASTVNRLLDHLKEAAFYSAKDLDSINGTLAKMKDTLERGKEKHSPHMQLLLGAKLEKCQILCDELQNKLAKIDPSLHPTHEKLVSILRSISACNTRSKFPSSEVKDLQGQLQQIEATMKDGKFVADDGTVLMGQEIMVPLLERCLLWSGIVLERKGKIDEGFQDVYNSLLEVRNHLEKLSLTQAWALRETDLFMHQRKLDRIDESRVAGNFVDHSGRAADLYAQRTLLYLLRRSYAFIYGLLISSEPVSEALLPIFNQLQTLRRCLIEVKRSGGVSSPRELYPYSMKLNSIDNMRVDGKFVVGGDIPEGQGTVMDLLSECYELSYEMRAAAEDDDE